MSSIINRLAPCLAVAMLAAGAYTGAPALAKTSKKRIPSPPKLTATVSSGGQVSLTANGRRVTHLHSGWYTVTVRVDSSRADFRLTGPRVRKATSAHFRGVVIWGVHFLKGTYRYLNDHNARATTHVISVS